MAFSAYLHRSPDRSIEQIHRDLEERHGSPEFYPRIELDFDRYERQDLMVQTEDYNVFATMDGLQFNGFMKEEVGEGWTEQSEKVWNYLEEAYLDGEESLEDELHWNSQEPSPLQ